MVKSLVGTVGSLDQRQEGAYVRLSRTFCVEWLSMGENRGRSSERS